MLIGYARCSTTDQDPALQLDALVAVGCERVFTDRGVSGSLASRPEWDRCLEHLRPGDTLVVWKLDRAARSLRNLLDLVETLAEEGYVVVADTGRGDTAVELVREHQPDVAIFDIKMPGLDGLEAARMVADEKICPVVMLTAFSQRQVIEQARDAGALAYLVKPFQKTDLVPAIELAIGRFAEMKAIAGERDHFGQQLELRKLLDRAKGILIDEHQMSEQDAFNFIQKTAMSRRLKMQQVAEGVLDRSITPND